MRPQQHRHPDQVLFLMQHKISYWTQWLQITLTIALGFDAGCPNSTFTVDTHATRTTRNKATTLQQQQHQHQILPTQGSHRLVREIPPSPPLPFTPPQLPAGPVLPGTVTQTGRMRPFPSQAQHLAPADVSPCPCSASCFERRGSGQDPGRLGASRDATWRLGRRGPCDPEPTGEASRGHPRVLAQCCKNMCMVGKGKKKKSG